ncbi:MAG: misacylated tRNA(Ala) deacylase [Woeseiaceae bacterium]|jgi:misacylated tRNA(Ala) deacylase|tara:strand:- start:36405 stop:37106 length:702 start_codon:yes stop_codon:yes gene_type:complete
MTQKLYRQDAYLKTNISGVTSSIDNIIILESSIFYPLGGGQPGDIGTLSWDGHEAKVINTTINEAGEIQHILSAESPIPKMGEILTTAIDWERRYLHMRMHTGLHLLGSVLKYGVTGGNISASKSRLDFDMEEPVDKEKVAQDLIKLVDENHLIQSKWISQKELREQPELIRTMSVKPPSTDQNIRLLAIGDIDLQPCGGTHLNSTGEVGQIRIGKVEKKGKRNRRVYIELID